MEKLKTVAKSVLGAFWVLEFSTMIFGLSMQIDHTISLSYGFGSSTALASINTSKGLTVSQDLNLSLSGEVSNVFFVSGNIGENSISNLVIQYLPNNLSFGTVQTVSYGTKAFSIVGLSTPNFSAGQLRGSVKQGIFKIQDPNTPIVLGPIAYQSLQIYVNGMQIPLNECVVNYLTGEVFIPNLVRGDVVTVMYQSMNSPSHTYVATLRGKVKNKNYALETSIFAAFATPTNQFFAFTKLSNILPSLSISTYINVDKIPSFKVEGTYIFPLEGGQITVNGDYNTKGFRTPMGVALNEGGDISILAQNSYGSLKFESNEQAFQVSVKTPKNQTTFYVGRNPNFSFNFSSDPIDLNLTAGSSETVAAENVSNENFSLNLTQSFGKIFEMSSMLNISTPITLEASFNSKNIGLKISKSLGPFYAGFSMSKDGSATVETSLSIKNQWLFKKIPISVGLCLQNSPPKLTSTLNTTIDATFGNISLSLGSSPSVNLTVTKYLGKTQYSLQAILEKSSTILDLSLSKNIGTMNANLGFTIAMVNDQIGGKIHLSFEKSSF